MKSRTLSTALRQWGTFFGLLAITLFFAWRLPETFPTAQNFLNISQQISMLAVAAFTMTIVMVMNDFDLSVGSTASLAGIVAAVLAIVALGLIFVAWRIIGGLFGGARAQS